MPESPVYDPNAINLQKDIAYKRASNIFRVGAYIYFFLCLLIWGSSIALLVLRNNLNAANVLEILTKPVTLAALAVAIIYWITSEFIKVRSRNAMTTGKIVAFFSLSLVPVGTIIGAIALVRLYNKNLQDFPIQR